MGEECRICGVFAFLIGPDETYARIEQGKWISESEYGTIHRVAGNGMTHGLLQRIVTYCEKKIPHLRIDTHQDNQIMQHVILKCGFCRCGLRHNSYIATYTIDSIRLVYQAILHVFPVPEYFLYPHT